MILPLETVSVIWVFLLNFLISLRKKKEVRDTVVCQHKIKRHHFNCYKFIVSLRASIQELYLRINYLYLPVSRIYSVHIMLFLNEIFMFTWGTELKRKSDTKFEINNYKQTLYKKNNIFRMEFRLTCRSFTWIENEYSVTSYWHNKKRLKEI